MIACLAKIVLPRTFKLAGVAESAANDASDSNTRRQKLPAMQVHATFMLVAKS